MARLQLSVDEADNIPILEVAAHFVEDFSDRGKNSTGRCCNHEDKKLGNLRFVPDGYKGNYAKCFTCGGFWRPVSLVMDFGNMDFLTAMDYLYTHFPSYFTEVKEYESKKWEGLLNKEYKFFKIGTNVCIGNEKISIRNFALNFPNEHDEILLERALNLLSKLCEIENIIDGSIPIEKIVKDREEVKSKIFKLLKKGLMNKSLIEKLEVLNSLEKVSN